jgi:hypothetical protein
VAAAGILGFYVSRNNDVDGDWAIGNRYSHALRTNAGSVDINLLEKFMAPPADEFRRMVSHY